MPADERCFAAVPVRGLSLVVSLPLPHQKLGHIVALTSASCITSVCSGDFLNLPSHYHCCKLHLHLAPFLLSQDPRREVNVKDDWLASVCSSFAIVGLRVLSVRIQTANESKICLWLKAIHASWN